PWSDGSFRKGVRPVTSARRLVVSCVGALLLGACFSTPAAQGYYPYPCGTPFSVSYYPCCYSPCYYPCYYPCCYCPCPRPCYCVTFRCPYPYPYPHPFPPGGGFGGGGVTPGGFGGGVMPPGGLGGGNGGGGELFGYARPDAGPRKISDRPADAAKEQVAFRM